MEISRANYHDPATKSEYMSSSQWRGWLECAARTKAEIAGEYRRPMTTAMMIGSYVDLHLTAPSELEAFCSVHKEMMFGKKGDKNADVRKAEAMVDRIISDQAWQDITKNAKMQVVMVGEIAGVKWSYMSDIQIERKGCETLLDLKTTASFEDDWVRDENGKNAKVNWIDASGYWRQLAVGRELFQQNNGTYPLCGIVAARKPTADDRPVGLGIWLLDDEARLTSEIQRIRELTPMVMEWKSGKTKAPRCGNCDYCLGTSNFESEMVAVSGRAFTV